MQGLMHKLGFIAGERRPSRGWCATSPRPRFALRGAGAVRRSARSTGRRRAAGWGDLSRNTRRALYRRSRLLAHGRARRVAVARCESCCLKLWLYHLVYRASCSCRFASYVSVVRAAAPRRPIAGRRTVAALGARAFDVLIALASAQAAWSPSRADGSRLARRGRPRRINLQGQVSALRKVLGGELIATIPGRGYRFTARSNASAASAPELMAAASTPEAAPLAACVRHLSEPRGGPPDRPRRRPSRPRSRIPRTIACHARRPGRHRQDGAFAEAYLAGVADRHDMADTWCGSPRSPTAHRSPCHQRGARAEDGGGDRSRAGRRAPSARDAAGAGHAEHLVAEVARSPRACCATVARCGCA